MFRAALRRERISRVEGLVSKGEVRRAPKGSGAGTGHDVHEHEASAVVLRRERIATEADAADLRFRRQLAAAKTVDADHGTWPRHLLEGGLHFVGIVGERVDLILREHGCECAAPGIECALAPVLSNLHVLGMSCNRKP